MLEPTAHTTLCQSLGFFFLIVDLCGDDRIKANVSMWKSSQRGILD